MRISSENVKLLLWFQELDTTLGDSREAETEQVYQFLDVLQEEATARGKEVYTHLMQKHHPSLHPWSTTRVMDYGDLPPSATEYEKKIVRAPAVLVLILARRPYLEPEKAGDEVAIEAPQWKTLWNALANWSPDELRKRIGENGWLLKQENISLPGPKPWTPPLTPNPVIPRPPIPEPEPPIDPAPPVEPEPPLDPEPPEDPDLPEEPEDDDFPEDEPEFTEDVPDDSEEVDEEPVSEDTDWKEIGKTAAWTVGVGALAYWLGKKMSA